MQIKIQDLGFQTNIGVIQSFVNLANLRLADIGCGGLVFTEQIAEFAGSVLAIDPDPIQAQKNRNSEHSANIEFVEADAQSFPAEDESIDGVFFAYSLHHVEAATYPQVFSQIFRVLKPGGFLYVIEPIDCPLNQVMKLLHDEEIVRAAAQDYLMSIASQFAETQIVEYHGYRQFESFEHFATNYSSKSFNPHYSEADVRHPDVQAAFHQHGQPDFQFTSPKRVVFMKGKHAAATG